MASYENKQGHLTCPLGSAISDETIFLKSQAITEINTTSVGDAVVSSLVCSSVDQVVRVQGLAGDITYPGQDTYTFTVPHSMRVYKWVLTNLRLG